MCCVAATVTASCVCVVHVLANLCQLKCELTEWVTKINQNLSPCKFSQILNTTDVNIMLSHVSSQGFVFAL